MPDLAQFGSGLFGEFLFAGQDQGTTINWIPGIRVAMARQEKPKALVLRQEKPKAIVRRAKSL